MVGKVVPPQKRGFLRKIKFKSETAHFFHKVQKKLDLSSPIHGPYFELVAACREPPPPERPQFLIQFRVRAILALWYMKF